jgi:hypothetical protein
MEIEWSFRSKIDYWSNIEYLEENWSEKEIISFIVTVENHLDLLKSNLITFNKTDFKNVYRIVIIKQITLYFTIKSDKIILLRFWNNYQDLSTFKLR